MKRPYFLNVTSVYDTNTDYPETLKSEIGDRIFTPADRYFYAYKKPGETITVEVVVEDWDVDVYCMADGETDIFCGESYGRS